MCMSIFGANAWGRSCTCHGSRVSDATIEREPSKTCRPHVPRPRIVVRAAGETSPIRSEER